MRTSPSKLTVARAQAITGRAGRKPIINGAEIQQDALCERLERDEGKEPQHFAAALTSTGSAATGSSKRQCKTRSPREETFESNRCTARGRGFDSSEHPGCNRSITLSGDAGRSWLSADAIARISKDGERVDPTVRSSKRNLRSKPATSCFRSKNYYRTRSEATARQREEHYRKQATTP